VDEEEKAQAMEGQMPENGEAGEAQLPADGETREAFGPPPPESVERLQDGDGDEEDAPEEKDGKKKKKGSSQAASKKKAGKKKKTGAKGQDGSSARRKVIVVVLLLAAVMLLSSVMTSIVLKLWGAVPPPAATPEPTPSESVEPSPSEQVSPTPTPAPTPTPMPQGTTQAQAREFFENLSPADLGLDGESMDEYNIYPAEKVVLVGDIPCVEVFVYSDENDTGTNDIQGRYLLSRSSPRRLFLLDEQTGKAKELDVRSYTIVTPAPDASPSAAASVPPQESASAGEDE